MACLSVESGTYDVICRFCTVKGMVVESEVLKARNCALSKFSLPMHSNDAAQQNGKNDVLDRNVTAYFSKKVCFYCFFLQK